MTARDALAQIAHSLRVLADDIDKAIEPEAARASVPPQVAAATGAGATAPASAPAPGFVDHGKCPSHGREWKQGQYGPYCTAQSDDPAWSNKRGYCSITPKSAPKWLEIHRSAPAQDVDDLPF